VVATSTEAADDAVAAFATASGIPCHRGPEDDVLRRFIDAAERFALDAVVRVSGDSPFLDPAIVDAAVATFRSGSWDLVTNVQVRSFPKGQSVEVVAAAALRHAAEATLNPSNREHVTPYFYARPEAFRIHNIAAPDPHPLLQLSIDTEADFQRAEALLAAGGAMAPLAELIRIAEGLATA
ncbi:MAG: acylneuraminate cytidylyltransferase, partial [Alphaproteobacteria bacterium]|nr:acylneuraminate cytidylyltransferase [Alphaproteobacteria bacterium]